MCKQAENKATKESSTSSQGLSSQTGTSSAHGTSSQLGTSSQIGTSATTSQNMSQTGSQNSSLNVSQTTLPEFVRAGGLEAIRLAQQHASTPASSYTAPRVAAFGPDSQNAFAGLRDIATRAGTSTAGTEAAEGARAYASAPAQRVGYEGTFDAGDISRYISPYVDNALQPALAKIQEASDAARKRLAATATGARAFGDARHGIAEADLNASTSQAMGDTAANFMLQAFDRAVGAKQGDLARESASDAQNAQLGEQALARLFQGSAAPLGQQGAAQQQQLQALQALLAGGQMQTGQQQASLDAAYQEFLRTYGADAANLAQFAQILGQVPIERGQTATGVQTGQQTGMQTGQQIGQTSQTGQTTQQGTTSQTGQTSSVGQTSQTGTGRETTTSQQPNNALLGLLGAAAGAYLGGPGGAQLGSSLFSGLFGGGGSEAVPYSIGFPGQA